MMDESRDAKAHADREINEKELESIIEYDKQDRLKEKNDYGS